MAAIPDNPKDRRDVPGAGHSRLCPQAGGSPLQPIAPIVRPAMQVRDRQYQDVAFVDGVDQPVREPAETAAANTFAEQMPSLRKARDAVCG